MNKYEDIIDTVWPRATTRKRMSLQDRAAQFAPFSALTGYEGAVKETARLTDHKLHLSSEQASELNYKLGLIQDLYPTILEVQITYFKKDPLKEGGVYVTKICEIKRIDEFEKRVLLCDGNSIGIGDILEIECSMLKLE